MGGTGVQTAAIALQYIPAGISGAVVVVRIWRKKVDRALGGGKFEGAIFPHVVSMIQHD
jgi:hypothetical protein